MHVIDRRWVPTLLLAVSAVACSESAATLAAQVAQDGAAIGAQTITPADLRARIGVLAHDSMRGRNTPSPELAMAADYVANEFRDIGLLPGNGDSYLQRYPLTFVRPGAPEAQSVRIRWPGGERALESSEFISVPVGERLDGSGPLVLLTAPDPDADVAGKVAVIRVTRDQMQRVLGSVRELVGGQVSGVILAVAAPPDYLAGMRRFFGRDRMSVGEPDALSAPVMLVSEETLPTTLVEALQSGGPLPSGFSAALHSEADIRRDDGLNTIGWLEGSDPGLQGEYIVFTAHMDHVGVGRAVNGDSIYNGADDDASGTAAIVELAEAYAAMPQRPRRSMVFMAVSGEEKGLLGSRWYSEHPLFPLEATVANLNLDMIGRNWRDTVVAIGREESTLGPTLLRVADEHPELNLTIIDDPWPNERFYFRSDHYNFARKGVPILFFFTGTHDDYHRPSDHPDRILYEKTSRITQLIYYLGLDIAEASGRPEWDPEAYRRVVEDGGDN
jgi:hypothetical protein